MASRRHSRRARTAVSAVAAFVVLPAALPAEQPSGTPPSRFVLTSPTIADGAAFPIQHTCDGPDLSPPLRWSEPPQGTKAFALIVEDPDAPTRTWVHWIVFNIPPDWREIPEAFPGQPLMADGTQQGKNDFGFHRYGGPCPPIGHTPHRYVITLYALDAPLSLPSQEVEPALVEGVREAMEGHVLAQAQLAGRYQRRSVSP